MSFLFLIFAMSFVAIDKNLNLVCGGNLNYGKQPSIVFPGKSFAMVSHYEENIAAIDTNGTLWVYIFPYPSSSDIILSSICEDVKFQTVSCGDQYIAAIDVDGCLWTCRYNEKSKKKLFKIEKKDCEVPFQYVNCFRDFCLLIDVNREIWMLFGGLLNMDLEPIFVQSTKFNNSCHVLSEDGLLFKFDATDTIQVSDQKFKQIESGKSHNVYLDIDGCLWVAGSNLYGQLGFEENNDRNKLQKIHSEHQFEMIYCSTNSTFALHVDGSLWFCGDIEMENSVPAAGTFHKIPFDECLVLSNMQIPTGQNIKSAMKV